MGLFDAPALSPTVAAATYARPVRPKVGFLGDSITIANDTNAGGNLARMDSPATHAMLRSDGRWDLITNAGIGGQTSTQILGRLQADIIDKGCTVCVINSCMWNDISNAFTVEQTMTNVNSMLNLLQAAGVQPVVALMTPDGRTGSNTGRLTSMEQRNRRLLNLAATRGVPVIDYQTPLIDPATGTILTTYNADGTVHPTKTGYKKMGEVAARVLDDLIPSRADGLLTYALDPTDVLVGKGLSLVDTDANGIGDGWSIVGGALPSGVTASIVTPAHGVGKEQRLTAAASVSQGHLHLSFTGGAVAVGQTVEISGRITTQGAGGRVQLLALGAPVGYTHTELIITTDQVEGRFKLRFVLPTGANGVRAQVTVLAGTGFVGGSQLAIRNLTTLGIA